MRQLLSKLLAGGLSAAVVLLWYPQFFPSDSVETWLIRGVVWTFSFELMLLAFGPFEEALWETRAGRALYRWLRARVRGTGAESARSQLRGRSAIAGAVLVVPIALLMFAPPQVTKKNNESAATPSVTHVTEVKRIVKVQRTAAPASDGATAGVPRAADRGAAPGGAHESRSRSVASRKPAARSGASDEATSRSGDAGDETPARSDQEESSSGTGTATDVADTPATQSPATTNVTPDGTANAGSVQTAPRRYAAAA